MSWVLVRSKERKLGSCTSGSLTKFTLYLQGGSKGASQGCSVGYAW